MTAPTTKADYAPRPSLTSTMQSETLFWATGAVRALLVLGIVSGCGSGVTEPSPLPSTVLGSPTPSLGAVPTLLTGPGESPTHDVRAGWTKYTAPDGSFGIAVPGDWDGEISATEKQFLATSPLGATTVTVTYEAGLLAEKGLRDVGDAMRINVGGGDLTESVVGGQSAWRLQSTDRDGTRVWYFLADPNSPQNMWQLLLETSAPQPDESFDAIVSSFALGPQGSP